ncbi:MAG: hypothetical protein Q9M75_00830 [Ghiorsea sp.]|nr:hypothetical protein [Ghiorsea sp.]MDQ7001728.1 hypothetical protein [Ghiorsea sp.]
MSQSRHDGCRRSPLLYHTPQSKAYYDKKRAEGKKHNQAVRSLARHLSRVI